MSKDNVVRLTYLDTDPKEMLEEISKKEHMKHAFVLTEQEDGELAFHCSTDDSRAMLMWMEQWKHQLLSGAFE